MTPSSRFPLAGFILCALATFPVLAAKHQKPTAIDPEWDDRGIDTTQPQWYRKHPFWTHIQKPFRKQCDAIVARLEDSVPVRPDTITYFTKGKVEDHADSVPGKCLHFYGKGLILRPQLLRSSPYHGTPVGVIRPEDGPWKLPLVYRPEGIFYPKRPDPMEHAIFRREGHGLDTVVRVTTPDEVLKLSYPGFKALVVNDSGRRLGWLPVDSIAFFPDSNDAKVSAPFYQDGIAAFVNGAWKERDHVGGGDGEPDEALMSIGDLHIQDMIHLWSVTLAHGDYDENNAPTYLKKCLIHQTFGNGKILTWLSGPCVEKSDSLPMGYFYKEAGWVRLRKFSSASAVCDSKQQKVGF